MLVATSPLQQVVVGGTAVDSLGHLEIAVPASDELVAMAESTGDELAMELSIHALVAEGGMAQSFQYAGAETAQLVVAPDGRPHFVVSSSVNAYILRPIGDTAIDLSPTVDVDVDSDGVSVARTSGVTVGQFNVLGIGAMPGAVAFSRTPDFRQDDTLLIGSNELDTNPQPSGECSPTGTTTYTYTPWHATEAPDDRSGEIDYTVVPYQRNGAHFRIDTQEETWQIVLCGFGSRKAINGWRLTRAGLAIAAWPEGEPKTPSRVGPGVWDTENDDKSADGSISFQVDVGPASVTVNQGTGSGGTLHGSSGVSGPQAITLDKIARPNVVHAWWKNVSPPWVDPCCRGSRSAEGVIVEGLYEWGQVTQPFAEGGMEPFAMHYCSSRKPCPLYN